MLNDLRPADKCDPCSLVKYILQVYNRWGLQAPIEVSPATRCLIDLGGNDGSSLLLARVNSKIELGTQVPT